MAWSLYTKYSTEEGCGMNFFIKGNLENETIQTRMRILNKFCQKLSKFNELFHSEEMDLFLSSNDVKKALSALPPQKYEDIYLKYKGVFHDYYKEYDDVAGKKKINDFLYFLKKAIVQIKVIFFLLRHSER